MVIAFNPSSGSNDSNFPDELREKFENFKEEHSAELDKLNISGLRFQTEFVVNLLLSSDQIALRNYILQFLKDNSDPSSLLRFMAMMVGKLELHPNPINKQLALKIIKDLDEPYVILANSDLFEDLDEEIAFELIERGWDHGVIDNLGTFKKLDHNKFASKLLENGKGYLVVGNLVFFKGLSEKIALRLLLEVEDGIDIIGEIKRNPDSFKEFGKPMLMGFLERGDFEWIIDNLDLFGKLSHQFIALKLINTDYGAFLAIDNFDKFKVLDRREIVLELIRTKRKNVLDYLIESDKELSFDKELMSKLIEGGLVRLILRYKSRIKGLSEDEVLLMLIKAGVNVFHASEISKLHGDEVLLALIKHNLNDFLLNLGSFRNLSKSIALKLIQLGHGRAICEHLNVFRGLDEELAMDLIRTGNVKAVLNNAKMFEGLKLNKDFLLKLIDKGYGFVVGDYLDRFTGLDNEIAVSLIRVRYGYIVARNLDKFKGVDHKLIASMLVEMGQIHALIENFVNFKGLHLTKKQLEDREMSEVIKMLSRNFHGVDKEKVFNLMKTSKGSNDGIGSIMDDLEPIKVDEDAILSSIQAGNLDEVWMQLGNIDSPSALIALKLIESGMIRFFEDYLRKFDKLNEKVAYKLIQKGYAKVIFDNLERFEGLKLDKKMALELVQAGKFIIFANHLSLFSGLDDEVAYKLIQKGYAKVIFDNLERFEGLKLDKKMALELIESGAVEVLAKHLTLFAGLDKAVVLELIQIGFAGMIFSNLEQFVKLDKEIALKLIEFGYGSKLIGHLDYFSALDKIVAIRLIDAGYLNEVLDQQGHFNDLKLDENFAIELIKKGYSEVLMKLFVLHPGLYFDKSIVSARGVISEIIGSGYGHLLIMNLNYFIDELDEKLVEKLILESFQSPFSRNYKRAVQVFGFQRIQFYVSHAHSVEDVLKDFDWILLLLQKSGLSRDDFFHNILKEVSVGSDNGLNLYKQLNEIAKRTVHDSKFKSGYSSFRVLRKDYELYMEKILTKAVFADPQTKAMQQLYGKLLEKIDKSGKKLYEIYHKAKPDGGISEEEIRIQLKIDLWKIISDVYRKHGDKREIDKAIAKLKDEEESMDLLETVLRVLPREEVAKISIDRLPDLKLTVLDPIELKENPKYAALKEQILNAIRIQFPLGDDIDFEENYLSKEGVKVYISTYHDELLTFFGIEEMDRGTKYLDWFIANPYAPLKGLGEAFLTTSFNKNIHGNCYLVAKPHVKSYRIFVERLGFVSFGVTDLGEYKHSYLRLRKFDIEKNRYVGQYLDYKTIRDICSIAPLNEPTDYKLSKSKTLKVCKVHFDRETADDNVTADSVNGSIFRIIPEMHQEGYVLTRYIPDPHNRRGWQTFYCIFEKTKFKNSDESMLMNEVHKMHAHDEDYVEKNAEVLAV